MLLLHEVCIIELMPMVLYNCMYHGCHGKLVLEGEEHAPINDKAYL